MTVERGTETASSRRLQPVRQASVSSSVIRSLDGVTARSRRKHDAKQASERHSDQYKSRPVKAKLNPRWQRPTLSMKEEYIGAGKLQPDTGRHGCHDKHDTNESKLSSLHAFSAAQRPSSATAGIAKVERKVGVVKPERWNGLRPRRFAGSLLACMVLMDRSNLHSELSSRLQSFESRNRRHIHQSCHPPNCRYSAIRLSWALQV